MVVKVELRAGVRIYPVLFSLQTLYEFVVVSGFLALFRLRKISYPGAIALMIVFNRSVPGLEGVLFLTMRCYDKDCGVNGDSHTCFV